MKRKIFVYSLLSALGAAGIAGTMLAPSASAHGPFGGFMGMGFGNLSADQVAAREKAMFERQAQILGISVDDVKNAWADGKTMQQLIQEKNLNLDQISARAKDAASEQLKSNLKSLVDAGVITQAQADKRLQFMQNRLTSGVGRMGKMHGRFGF